MKKAISVILMLIAAILSTACSGSKMSAPEGSTSAVTKDPDELFAEKMRQQQYDYWVTYVNPKSNEEMKAYGYNDNGELILPLSELRHCEEIFPQKVLSQSRKPDPVADRFKPGSVEYGHSEYGIEIIGYVTDLVSHCVREENILNSGHDEELPGIPKQWYVIYNGIQKPKSRLPVLFPSGTMLRTKITITAISSARKSLFVRTAFGIMMTAANCARTVQTGVTRMSLSRTRKRLSPSIKSTKTICSPPARPARKPMQY